MGRSLTVGRIQDIDVKVHPTFGLVVLWVFFDVGSGGIGFAGGPSTLLFGAVLVALVFGCVLLHELGHSFMAKQFGIRVHDVTLSIIGGVARIEQVPSRPAAEVLIALAGPAMNVAILVALFPILLLYGLVQGFDSPFDYLQRMLETSPGGLLIALFWANALLVVFNLLPAFPMDGGRILRATLASMIGRERGTRAAVLVGQGIAVLLAILGFWLREWSLPLIGLFVIVLAQAEGRVVRIEAAMRRLRVGQFALWDMGGIAPHQPLTFALRGGPRDVAVTENGRVVGMLWRHQLLHSLNAGGGGRTVGDVMDRDVVTANADESLYDVQQRMNALNRWAFPVVENGVYRGIFTADRFVHVYQQLSPFPLRSSHAPGIVAILQGLVRAWIR